MNNELTQKITLESQSGYKSDDGYQGSRVFSTDHWSDGTSTEYVGRWDEYGKGYDWSTK